MTLLRTLLLLVMLIATSAYSADDAGVESPFVLGAGARSLGMGGATISLPFDANAIYYNPAGLPRLEYQEIALMHMSLFEGTIYDVATWASPVNGLGGFGVGFMRIGTDDIIRRTDFIEQGTFDYSSWQFLLAYGRNFGKSLSAGMTFKVLNSSIDDLSDYGIGLDAGMQLDLFKHMSLGVMARDIIPPQLTLDSLSEDAPVSLIGGLALNRAPLSGSLALSAAVDLEKIEDRDLLVHTGVELLIAEKYALRGGYDRDDFTFGAGIGYGRLKIDYAYKLMDYIEDSHRFSLSILIGPSVTEQKRRRETEEAERGDLMLQGERDRQFQFFRAKADTFYQRLELDSALSYYQRALAFDERNNEILGTISAIQRVQKIQEQEMRRIQEAQKEQANFSNTYYEQARLFYNKKYYPAALDLINLVLDIEPNNERALELRNDIVGARKAEVAESRATAAQAEKDGHLVVAIEAYNRILELTPDDAEVRAAKQRLVDRLDVTQQLKLGIDLFNGGKLSEARRQFEAVLRVNPQDPVALEYMGKLGAVAPMPPTLEDLQKDKEIWPLYLEGLRHMRNKDYQKAIDAWERVLKVYPNNASTIENIRQAKLRLQSQ
ncbi:MAG: PorV/PorQ family protein [bacterium]|nr:PorV/PorQ family protein [bacterium]